MDQFKLGKMVGEIKAWCEAAKNEAKELSLSAPFKPEEYETLLPHMKEQAEKNSVNYYLEKSLIITDLFGDMDLSGIWVFLIFKHQKTLEAYLKLKEDKEKLVDSGEYEGKKRREIAVRFGRLLGYSDRCILERWS
jgi:hypothetical protein